MFIEALNHYPVDIQSFIKIASFICGLLTSLGFLFVGIPSLFPVPFRV